MQIIEFLKRILEVFKRQILVARIFEIPVRIDSRWFLVLILMSWLTATNIPNSVIADLSTKFVFGLITTLVFFFSIFLHELGHALVARMEEIEVREIVLHPFGGLARFKRPPDTPRAEFRVAIAGPATSFLISIVFLAIWIFSQTAGLSILTPFAFLLFFWNLLLAVFNLFPGYPLDGGRVLRAYLWKQGKDLNEATVLTGRAGQIIGVGLMVVGALIAVLQRDFFTGLWTVVVGIFLFDAALGIIKEVGKLEETRVAEVMSLPISVSPLDNIVHFVDNILPLRRQTTFLVAKDRQFYGVLTLEDLKSLEKSEWHRTKVQEIMRPVAPEYFVEADTLLSEARDIMRQNGIGAVGVVDEQGQLVGYLQRRKIRRVK
jgi:Zn-dependent protease/predicted transcriptional regulator